MCRQQLPLEFLIRPPNARFVAREVIPQFVTLLQNPPEESLVTGDPIRDDEEGGASAVPLQNIEDPRRRNGVGTVVNRESHQRTRGLDEVQYLG